MDETIWFIYTTFIVYPIWRIFKRTGKSGYFVLLLILYPLGFIVLLYVLAYSKWNLPESEGDS